MMQTLRDQAPAAEFTGWLAPDEVRRHLRSARALVFPSLWYETLGIVALEAAAAGVPAIISDRCAATDFVIDGETGLHFQHGSASSLADAMSRLAGDPGLAVRLGAAAHAWYWDQPWSTERHVRELMGAYTAALANA
jgi:glycosyltransferase involved in cell wall biosynthesis